MPEAQQGSGLAATFRRGGDSLLALALNRLQLAAVELHQEKVRFAELLLWFGAALLAGFAGTIVLVGSLTYLMWSIAGNWGVAGVIVAAFALCGWLIWRLRRSVMEAEPFSATIGEFRKDFENHDDTV